jgi:hypothetical protein
VIDISILRALADAGASKEALLAAIEADQKSHHEKMLAKREGNRIRKQRQRERHAVSRVTACDDAGQSVTPPVHILPPQKEKKIKASPLSMRATPFPDDYTFGSQELEFALSKGWTELRAREQFDRFRDHAHAGGRKQVSWQAAWRKWVTSPYQGQQHVNGGKNGKPSFTEVFDQIRAETANGSDWGLHGSRPTDVKLLPEGRCSRSGDLFEGGGICIDETPGGGGNGRD